MQRMNSIWQSVSSCVVLCVCMCVWIIFIYNVFVFVLLISDIPWALYAPPPFDIWLEPAQTLGYYHFLDTHVKFMIYLLSLEYVLKCFLPDERLRNTEGQQTRSENIDRRKE